MFIVLNNSSLELDDSHSCLHVTGLKPLNSKLKKNKSKQTLVVLSLTHTGLVPDVRQFRSLKTWPVSLF